MRQKSHKNSSMVLRHEGARRKVRGKMLRNAEQPYKVSSLCFFDHDFEKEELESMTTTLRGRNEICRRIVGSVLTNGTKMLVLGTNWQVRHFMVSKQTCSISHKIDRSL